MSAPPLVITRWPSLLNTQGRRETLTREAFAAEFRKPRRVASKGKLAGWSPALFDGDKRLDENVTALTALPLDHDGLEVPLDTIAACWAEFAGFVHTSHSHGFDKEGNARPELTSARAVLWLSRTVTPDEYARLWLWAEARAARAGVPIDPSTKNVGRLWFAPGARPNAPYELRELAGSELDVDAVLAKCGGLFSAIPPANAKPADATEPAGARASSAPPPPPAPKASPPPPKRTAAGTEPAEEHSRVRALRARGLLGTSPKPGTWVVPCPRADLHTTGQPGDTSSVIFASGAFRCAHAHCTDVTLREFDAFHRLEPEPEATAPPPPSSTRLRRRTLEELRAVIDAAGANPYAPDVLRAALELRSARTGDSQSAGAAAYFEYRRRFGAEWDQAVALAACPPGRTPIAVTTDEHIMARELTAALAANCPEVYQRGGELVHTIVDDADIGRVKRKAVSPRLAPVARESLRGYASAAAYFCTVREREVTVGDDTRRWSVAEPARPDGPTVAAVHAAGRWSGIRRLDGIAECPVLREDGSVLARPGFDEATGLLATFRTEDFPPVPEHPTQEDARAALERLREPFRDFPFATDAHRDAALAGVFTVLARPAYAGPAPLSVIDANVRGAGKTLVADIIGLIVSGRVMPRMPPPEDDAEAHKSITALARAGVGLVLIDNIVGAFGSPALDGALTCNGTWSARVLGATAMLELPLLASWWCTGNNVALKGDLGRRALHIRLESPEERPERREGFEHDPLLPWVLAHRGELVRDALTVARAWVLAGRPTQRLARWGSFEGWSDLVRNAIVWAGGADPGETRDELQSTADTEASALASLLVGWREMDLRVRVAGEDGISVAALIKELDRNGEAARGGSGPREALRYLELRDAIAELCSVAPDRAPTAKALGNQLRKFRGRVLDGKRLVMGKQDRNGVARWKVESVRFGQDSAGSAGSAGSVSNPVGEESSRQSNASRGETTPHVPQTPQPQRTNVAERVFADFPSDDGGSWEPS